MVVDCARTAGGKAMEMVAVVPPIMKARRVAAGLLRPVGRSLMVTSPQQSRCMAREKVFAQVSTVLQALCHDRGPGRGTDRVPKQDVEAAMWIAERGEDLDFPTLVDPNTTAL